MTIDPKLAPSGIPFVNEGEKLTPAVLQRQEETFPGLLRELSEKTKAYKVTIRVIGSLAFRIRCPEYRYMAYDNGRYLTDIDFVTYERDIIGVQDLFLENGWSENQNVLRMAGHRRRIFYHPEEPIHSDIFIDKLRFCHEIDLRGRLEIDPQTISLVDLLLEKLQIVEINRKDLVDAMVLLRQYAIAGEGPTGQRIDGGRLAKLCAGNWGLWKTTTMNLSKISKLAGEYLEVNDAWNVRKKVASLARLIEAHPRSVKWKIRSLAGERIRWYNEVEELQRD